MRISDWSSDVCSSDLRSVRSSVAFGLRLCGDEEVCLKRISLSILLLVPTPVFAEDGLSLSGSTRLRYEVIDGQPRAGFNESDDLVSIRTIVTGEYRTRSEERLVGKGCVSTCRSRGWASHAKKKN